MYLMEVNQQLALSLTKVNDRTPVGFSEGSGSGIQQLIFHPSIFCLLISICSGGFFVDFFADISIFQSNRFHVPDFTCYLLDFLLHCKYLSFCIKL